MARAALVTTLADSGAIYALIDQSDRWHRRVTAWWRAARRAVLLPVTVLPEIAYLLHTRIGADAEEAFARALAAGELPVEPLEVGADVARAAELLAIYRDQDIGLVDATIVALAERLGITEILTTDRRHFGVIRPRHTREFVLVP
ncbi:MAG: PIN domain-containing protein [Gemmatimonadales bacterium]|nr:PIN domain-containing protein [Gemmatimonadales bacterium]NIN48595.1 PIN domain-containing protein [Gemmatimonadales bacterium]NIP06059.1 PIN domain-containing protein [Gemmatimonadales bacterium]NIQ98616.1 PIN domain-containing protein [Gemmatimonadales bacterium]NIS63536.1 PIN domain-containing protein [Gemmatimonadales bacterium]